MLSLAKVVKFEPLNVSELRVLSFKMAPLLTLMWEMLLVCFGERLSAVKAEAFSLDSGSYSPCASQGADYPIGVRAHSLV